MITELEKRTVGSVDASRTTQIALVCAREAGKESSPGCAARSGRDQAEPEGFKCDNMVTRRAVLVTAFGTAIAGRNEHVYRRTVCDVQVDFDMERSEVRVGAQPFRFPLRNKIECAEATQRVSQQDL